MEIKCTVQELRELIENKKETPVDSTTDEMPPHKFLLFDAREYLRTCKEEEQEVPKEERN